MTSSFELKQHAENLKGARVLVLGDLMLDTYLIGEAARISPEAPVPVVKLTVREDRLGGAANCAMNIAALGGEPILVGAIGKNEAGDRFLEIVHHHGFEVKGIICHDQVVTTRKVRVVADRQQIVRVDEEEPLRLTEFFMNKVIAFVEKTLPKVDAVAVSDYAKGFINARLMTAVHDLSRKNKIPVLVDPKPVNVPLFKGCDLLKPNRKETSELSGIDIVDENSCDAAANLVMQEFHPRALLITRGPEGMDLYCEESNPVRIRTRVSHIYDVSGAGDTVLATLSLSYAKGIDPVPACELAAAAAAVAVTKPTTSTVSPGELITSIQSIGD